MKWNVYPCSSFVYATNLSINSLKVLLRDEGNFLNNVKHLQHTWGNDFISGHFTTNEAFSCSLTFILRLKQQWHFQQFEKNWSVEKMYYTRWAIRRLTLAINYKVSCFCYFVIYGFMKWKLICQLTYGPPCFIEM